MAPDKHVMRTAATIHQVPTFDSLALFFNLPLASAASRSAPITMAAASLSPHWVQPSHPELMDLCLSGDPRKFESSARSRVALPPGAIFAKLSFPPCTFARNKTFSTIQMSRNTHVDLNSDLYYLEVVPVGGCYLRVTERDRRLPVKAFMQPIARVRRSSDKDGAPRIAHTAKAASALATSSHFSTRAPSGR